MCIIWGVVIVIIRPSHHAILAKANSKKLGVDVLMLRSLLPRLMCVSVAPLQIQLPGAA